MLKFLHSLEYNSDAKCINGFFQTINAVLMIADATFLTDPTLNHICVSRFNQDPLENMFSKIRANGGFNRHPNAHEVGVFNSMNSNCENNDENIMCV